MASKSVSKTVLKQLQQNESLRIQNFRIRSDMRDQHHHFINSTINQEMLAQKMLTELCLAYRRGKDAKNYKQEHSILSNAVKHCIGNLQNLLEAYSRLKDEWSNIKQQDPTIYYQQLLSNCSERFEQAQSIIERLSKERDGYMKEAELKRTQIQLLQGKLGRNKSEFEQIVNENNALKAQICRLQEMSEMSEQKIRNLTAELSEINSNNDELFLKLKQSRQIVNKRAQYMQTKYENIERQNERLVQLQRQASLKEQQLTLLIQQKQTETSLIRQQAIGLKSKLKQIISKEERIKNLQKDKHITASQPSLLEKGSENTITTLEQRPLKREVGKMTKKFNLQTFQEQVLSNSYIR